MFRQEIFYFVLFLKSGDTDDQRSSWESDAPRLTLKGKDE